MIDKIIFITGTINVVKSDQDQNFDHKGRDKYEIDHLDLQQIKCETEYSTRSITS